MIKRLNESNNGRSIDWSKYSGKYYISLYVYGFYEKYNPEYDDWSGESGEVNADGYNVGNTQIDINNFNLWEWLQKNCYLLANKKQSDCLVFPEEDGRLDISIIEDQDGCEYNGKNLINKYLVDYSFYIKINGKLIEEEDLHIMLPNAE